MSETGPDWVTSENRRQLARLRAHIESFIRGETDIEFFQPVLESTLTVLERDQSGVLDAVFAAQADVEEIRFTRATSAQRPAVLRVVEDLLTHLPPDSSAV